MYISKICLSFTLAVDPTYNLSFNLSCDISQTHKSAGKKDRSFMNNVIG